MVETVKLTEVTDVVTPEEETTPKNYNFSMESTWEETIYSQGGGDEPTGTIQIAINGTHDVTQYASAQVNVPNSYSASDEGKVVSNGALVAQTSQSITANNTYDTTLINEVVVNVASSGGIEPTWNTVDVITIGANSVSNTQEAKAYFSSYSYDIILLLEQPTVSNQICTFIAGQPTRYRNGEVSGVVVGTSYDARVVEGTKYLLLKH